MTIQDNCLVVTYLEDMPVMAKVVCLSPKPGAASVVLRTPEGWQFEVDMFDLEKVENFTF